MNHNPRRYSSLLVFALALLLCAGCNIYRSVDEPPSDDDTGATDVVDDDAATDTGADTGEDTGEDTAEDTGDTTTSDAEDAGNCVPVGDPDEATFYCDLANSTCGDITVEDDCGTTHNVNCGSCDSGGNCTGGPMSFPRTCSCDCDIEGSCYSQGAQNPSNPCQICDSSTPNQWSAAANSTQCDDGDGLGCTGLCDAGSCEPTLRSGSCAIDDTCYADGDPNPSNPCEVCDPSTSTTSWTSNEGGACDDGDGLSCTGICVSGTCESQPRDSTCLIDGTCYSDGEQSSSNECEVCITAESQTAWSPSNAFSCGGSNSCTCNDSFQCVKINGNPCN